MLKRLTRAVRGEDGQALVELTMVLPILLLILFAIFDLGRAVQNWNSETSLATVGARYAAVGSLPNSTADPTCGGNTTIVTYIQCEASNVYGLPSTSTSSWGLQGPVSVVVCAPGGASATAVGDPIEVKVSANYQFLPVEHLNASVPVTATATMRLENAFPSSLGTVSAC